jgi:cytochrome c oxidase assembly protein subunit 11
MRNGRLALGLVAVAATMVGASFAAVPFYDWFCRVTGFGGTTGVATAPTEVLDRTITVRFDANVHGMPWEFRPQQRTMRLRLGESALAFYEARNPTDRPLAGQAGYNVTPFAAGAYFDKIACFCFELQLLQPGERVDMPVSFRVDPAMLADVEARGLTEITLSYTMYPAELPESARLAAVPGESIE